MTDRSPLLLFQGDSITDAGRRDPGAPALGGGYVALVAEELRGSGWRVGNAGISGDRVVDLEQRWQDDTLAAEPELLSIYIGINDVWRRYDSDDPTSVEAFEAGYRRLLERTVAAGIRSLVLVEPFLVVARPEQAEWFADLDPKREAVRRLAAEFGAALVPLQEPLSEAAERDGADAIAPDGVHPAPAGARLIADRWLAVTRAAALL